MQHKVVKILTLLLLLKVACVARTGDVSRLKVVVGYVAYDTEDRLRERQEEFMRHI
jgi:hypothetical protein